MYVAPGTAIVGFSLSIQLYDETYFTFLIGDSSGAVGRVGWDIVSRILVVSKPSFMLASGRASWAGLVVEPPPPSPPSARTAEVVTVCKVRPATASRASKVGTAGHSDVC
jgi:hypothetical protein